MSKIDSLFWERKERKGPENELVHFFLSQYKNFFNSKDLSSCVYTEPCLGIGFPDILMAIWDKEKSPYWNTSRNSLTKTDIKILHFLSTTTSIESIESINLQLGYSIQEIKKSISSLESAGLLIYEDYNFKILDLSEIFFIKDIIAIEAKLHDWKKVIEQASLNQLFCSQSYVLIPESSVSQKMNPTMNQKGLGLIVSRENQFCIKKTATRSEIPASYTSWIINEEIGRKLYGNR